ncbi:ras oncogene family protein, putative [Ichthyophthirius multifiliis]|uniref:Ras oncogene family protein, putative n=1 Tax=Ichthyophthirius multifiliis TaxID=5932 RepID=G0QV23_ICHMU|nr:ras oncogene family protein, putative [Ichthyophthirius multifiliis]EGR30930.1 ras oncogene family protein, putative [Ichthyophthirius multifiliis]|eukprot:XP_004032517.1 ras oncogene family protein, putative [Ichthyophthirius multifiliis]
MLGDSGVGKTSILNRFVQDKFDNNCPSTLGASFIPKVLIKGDKQYKFQIWDTAGQEKYKTLAPLYYRGFYQYLIKQNQNIQFLLDSHAALIVYDITNKQSFQVLQNWVNELNQNGPPNIVIAVVGNKVDLIEKEEVKYEDAKAYARNLKALFQYTSAKENKNVVDLFEQIAEKIDENQDQVQKEKGQSLRKDKGIEKAKGGCC